ncbi:MAG: LamG-like jellyroll fold domain-containing protein [Bacteroidia bacterium]|nr:LamG-like jellyroll fold domain-containing protein [Bacteroidia bacterium]
MNHVTRPPHTIFIGLVFYLLFGSCFFERNLSEKNEIGPVLVIINQNGLEFKAQWNLLTKPDKIVEYGFAWAQNNAPDPELDEKWSRTLAPKEGDDSVIVSVSGLRENEKYWVVAYFKENKVDEIFFSEATEFIFLGNSGGSGGSNQTDINIGGNKLSTISIKTRGAETATVAASWLTLNVSEPIKNYGFVWSLKNNPTLNVDSAYTFTGNPSGTGEFSYVIHGLQPFEDYYVRTFVQFSTRPNPELGSIMPFRTTGYPPVVETGLTSSKSTDRATIEGKIIAIGSTEITEYGHVWSTDSRPTLESALKSKFNGPTGDNFIYQTNITNLQDGAQYFYRAYAQNNDSSAYGDIFNFKTESLPLLQVVSVNIIAESLEPDQKVNRGETVSLQMRVRNGGDTQATGCRIEVSSNDPNIVATSPGFVDLGAIAGNSSVEKIGVFDVSVDPFASWDSTIVLDITLSDDKGSVWKEKYSFIIESQFVVAQGLLAYYTFDLEDSSTTKINSEINNEDYYGFRYNNPTFSTDVAGTGGKSLWFSSNNNTYVQLGKNPFFNQTLGTLNLWLKTSDSDGVLVSETNPNRTLIHLINNTIAFATLGNCSNSNKYFGVDNQELRDNQWHMLTVTIKDGEQKIYFDGDHRVTVNIDVNTTSANCLTRYYGLSHASTDNGYTFGAYHPTGSTALYNLYSGWLDNIRFYNRILSDSEINQIFDKKQ